LLVADDTVAAVVAEFTELSLAIAGAVVAVVCDKSSGILEVSNYLSTLSTVSLWLIFLSNEISSIYVEIFFRYYSSWSTLVLEHN
jgi:hypothetical protein